MSHKKAKYAKKHKDRLFRFIFNHKSELLSLYNAVNDSDYSDENDLTIYTIEDFIYMGMKNDLSFLIDCHLNIYEHQSTYNPNMPLRGFFYMAAALKKYVAAKNLNLYASSQLTIPVPQFYVFISCIRDNTAIGLPLEDAIEKAVTYCIHNNILAEILRNHKAEVTDMLLYEYDENFHIACEKKLSFEEGRAFEKHFTDIERQRADAAILSRNILLLHLKHFSNEAIAEKLNVSDTTIQETLSELYSETGSI